MPCTPLLKSRTHQPVVATRLSPRGRVVAALALVLAVALPLTCVAQDPPMNAARFPAPDPDAPPEGFPNITFGTMGGKQFWTDFVIRDNWRIQQNIYTGHFRLLNPKNQRVACGNYAHCWRKLQSAAQTEPLGVGSEHVIVLLHGLGRSRSSMASMEQFLREHTDCEVINFSYASTRATLSDHAFALQHMLSHLTDARDVSFVCHSLGNLVVRRMLDEYTPPKDIRYSRMVMLGPPNLGAQLARRFQNNILFNLVWGQSGKQLAKTWDQLEPHLATPEFEFGVLAGGAASKFTNPLVDGEDDLIVSVEETRLPGACDFRRVGAIHTLMPSDDQVQKLTAHFLTHGFFETVENCHPIPASQEP